MAPRCQTSQYLYHCWRHTETRRLWLCDAPGHGSNFFFSVTTGCLKTKNLTENNSPPLRLIMKATGTTLPLKCCRVNILPLLTSSRLASSWSKWPEIACSPPLASPGRSCDPMTSPMCHLRTRSETPYVPWCGSSCKLIGKRGQLPCRYTTWHANGSVSMHDSIL